MVNAREQIYQALQTCCDNVSVIQPEKAVTLPLIVYGEITNTTVSKWVESIEFQVDVYAADFEEMVELAEDADAVMRGIGFSRIYASPDANARIDTDLYKKALNYHANVDTYHGNILKED